MSCFVWICLQMLYTFVIYQDKIYKSDARNQKNIDETKGAIRGT